MPQPGVAATTERAGGKADATALAMRARILVGATELFRKLPVSKITMEDVAREAGVVRSTVYKCFRNKEELLGALFAHEVVTHHHPVIRALHEKTISIDNLSDMFLAELDLALDYILVANTFDPSKIPGIAEIVLNSAELRTVNESLWIPILEDYQVRGLIKPDLDLRETVRWFTYQHVWLISHPTALADATEQRNHYVRTYLFGALAL